MREIKFRAWDKINKRMGFFDGLEWDDEYCEWYLREVEKPTICDVPPGENVEVMQYTGLHDKNGREIYEGDIVRRSYRDGQDAVVISFHPDLGYDSKSGMASGFYFQPQLEYYDDGPRAWEVVGNIYENPELLK